jgi:hypothetical protein
MCDSLIKLISLGLQSENVDRHAGFRASAGVHSSGTKGASGPLLLSVKSSLSTPDDHDHMVGVGIFFRDLFFSARLDVLCMTDVDRDPTRL